MAAKDIEKLKEKFEKDPNSKLFLPLAEEYRKEGMLDEAIEVLQIGLEKHQAYTSARVLLGKIYLEKGMLDEARKEFEGVIASVPDNLFAHKKLAEIYRDTGEAELAIRAFKTILKLNPMDEDVLNSLKDLEAVVSGAAPVEEASAELSEDHPALKMPVDEVAVADEGHHPDDMQISAPDVQMEHTEEELNAFKDSLFGMKEMETDSMDLDVELPDEDEPARDEVTVADEGPADDAFDISFGDVAGEIVEEATGEATVPAGEISIEDAETEGDMMSGLVQEEAVTAAASGNIDFGEADRLVAQERYAEAVSLYRRWLASDPDNRIVLQRMDELRGLLKLLGKDNEELVARLNMFLEGVQKRRDEFFGRS